MAETPGSRNSEREAQSSPKPLSPQLKIEPASEWADNTVSALDSALPPTSPSLNFPGSYPYSPTTLEPGPTLEEIRDTARQYIHTAGQYVPSQENVRKIAHNASNTVREYFPNNISTRLGPGNLTQEAIPTSPLEESETTPSSGGGFILINRGKAGATRDETQSGPGSQHPSVNNPAQAPSEISVAPRTKLQIVEPEHGKNDANSVQIDQSSENASLKVLPGSRAESIGYRDSVPTPYSYTAKLGFNRSLSNSGTLVSNGHPDQRISEITEINGVMNTQDDHGDDDVLLGPGREGSITAQKGGVSVSSTSPGPKDDVLATIEDEGSEEALGPIQTNVPARNAGKVEIGNRKEERRLEGTGIKDDELTNPRVEGIPLSQNLGEEKPTEAQKQSAARKDSGRTNDLPPQLSPNLTVERVEPSIANIEREKVASTSKSPLQETRPKQKDRPTGENPQPHSPATSANNPHDARAMSEHNVKDVADPSTREANGVVSPHEEQRSGRKKGNLVQRLKTWSKKLGHNKNGQNQKHTAVV